MKITYFVITVLLIVMKTNICLQAKIDHSLYISPNPQINFFEMKSSNKIRSSNSITTTGELKYNAKIAVTKEKDTLEDQPIEFDAQIELGKDNLKVYIDGKLKKEITYVE